MKRYPVMIQQDNYNSFVVTVPDLPGCVSSGSTIEDALKNARDAIISFINSLKKHGDNIPCPTKIEDYIDTSEVKDVLWQYIVIKEHTGFAANIPIEDSSMFTKINISLAAIDKHFSDSIFDPKVDIVSVGIYFVGINNLNNVYALEKPKLTISENKFLNNCRIIKCQVFEFGPLGYNKIKTLNIFLVADKVAKKLYFTMDSRTMESIILKYQNYSGMVAIDTDE